MIDFIFFILGLSIGSFLNVCVYRISNDISLIKPPSFCPNCKGRIAFYDNVPLISYILLKGKCRRCKEKISARYPAVELFTGIVTLLMAHKWITHPYWLIAALIASYALIAIMAMDFETMMIADIFSYLLLFSGIVFSWANPVFDGNIPDRILSSVYGAAGGTFLIWSMAFIGKKIYKKDAVGEGDIFLMGGIGSLLGIEGIFSTLIMASFFGSVYAIFLIALKKTGRLGYMPFGPFLALAAIINLYSFVRISTFFLY